MPGGMNLPVRRHRAAIMAARAKETSRDTAVAGLQSLPCTAQGKIKRERTLYWQRVLYWRHAVRFDDHSLPYGKR